MKKFGFGKKGGGGGGDDGDDSNRNALFGRKKASPAPPSDNPYASQGVIDPYAEDTKYANMSAYQQAKVGLGGPPRPGGPPAGASGSGPGASPGYGGSGYGSRSPAPNGGGYGAPPAAAAAAAAPSGYGPERYGSGGGYGANRYGSGPNNYNSTPPAGSRGPGGYGGLGRPAASEPDNNRDALFAGAQQRYQQKQDDPSTSGATGQDGSEQSGAADGTYGGYGEERELTAEEQEDAEYQAILSQKKQLQQDSASSVNRSVQMARQANEVGRATLARLGAQGERLHNTEKNLDLAANQNKIAQDRAAELKTLNRSMFAVHVSNPFTAKQREAAADANVLSRHRDERGERESTRRDGYSANQRMESNFRDFNKATVPRQQARKKDYGKFNLDDEEGANELEDEIDDGINELEGQVHMMNMVGRAIGKEVDTQNGQIDRIMNKVRIFARNPWVRVRGIADKFHRATLLMMPPG